MELNTKFNWQSVEGWLGDTQLYDKIIREASHGDILVQLNGSAKNICYLASRAKLSKKAIRIINIQNEENLQEMMTNSGVIDVVTTINANIKSAANIFLNQSIFATFIKSHDFKTTSHLIETWKFKIKKEGYIIGNNILIPEVKKAVKNLYPYYNETEECFPTWFTQV